MSSRRRSWRCWIRSRTRRPARHEEEACRLRDLRIAGRLPAVCPIVQECGAGPVARADGWIRQSVGYRAWRSAPIDGHAPGTPAGGFWDAAAGGHLATPHELEPSDTRDAARRIDHSPPLSGFVSGAV